MTGRPAGPADSAELAQAGPADSEGFAADPVRHHARRRPHDDAVIEVDSSGRPGATLTWSELDRQADRTAAALLDAGVKPGDVVAYQLPNRIEFVTLSTAVRRIGAVCCPMMPIFREREIDDLLRRSHARVFVICAAFRGRDHVAETASVLSAPGAPAVEHVLVVGGEGPLPGSGEARWQRFDEAVSQSSDSSELGVPEPAPDAIAQLMFTSGTSGEPKGVLHTRGALDRAVAVQARHLGLTGRDRLFIPSPLAHQTGFLYGMWLGTALGAPMVLQPAWNGSAALAALHHTGATFVQAATPFLADLVEAVDAGGEPPEALRIFVATGTAVPRSLAERATRTLGAAVCGAWGSTESCLGTLGSPMDEPARAWGTDGRAPDGVRVRVRDADGDGRVLPPGVEGDFEVFSDCLFVGYLDRPELTAAALTADGWYRSGDLAVIDEAGYTRITGRVKDIVNRGGEKIPVAEVEQLLHTHPAVREVAIVAMPDPRLGERACAFVVAREPFTLGGMRMFLDEHKVAKQYWPERLETVAELPRNAVGKVQKFVLRDRLAAVVAEEER